MNRINHNTNRTYFYFVLSKCDGEKVKTTLFNTESDVKKFICETLNLHNIVALAESFFKNNVHYYAVSALSQSIEDSKINSLKAGILKDLGIK